MEITTGGTNVLERNQRSTAKTVVNVGGSGSSKSYSVAQLMISKLLGEQNKQIIVARKTMPACKRSCYGLIIDLLKEYGVYNEARHNKSDNIYYYGTNSMWFVGLDEPTKIKSIKGGVNYIWLEEATEFTYEDYLLFKIQLRKPAGKDRNQIFLSLNPIDAQHWIAKRLILEEDVEVVHSTFEDNQFLSEDAVLTLQQLFSQDENYYRVYALGEWGLLENLIYSNYKIIPELPDMEGAKFCYGLDYGLVAPSAIVQVYIQNDKLYWEEKFYKTGKTTSDIIEFFSHLQKADIYPDPSAKMMNEEVRKGTGWNVYDGHKNVKEGIDLCLRQIIHIPESSVNLIKEIRGYHWKKDRFTGEIMPEPVKYNDHCMDSGRTGTWGITSRYGFATRRPVDPKPIKTLDFGTRHPDVIEKMLARS